MAIRRAEASLIPANDFGTRSLRNCPTHTDYYLKYLKKKQDTAHVIFMNRQVGKIWPFFCFNV
jgi:hypothetical protein